MKVKVGDTVSVSTHDMSYVRVLGVVKHVDGVQYGGSRKELAFVEFVGRDESGWFTEAELAVVAPKPRRLDLDRIAADYAEALRHEYPIQMTTKLALLVPDLLAEIRAYRHAESMQADDFGFR